MNALSEIASKVVSQLVDAMLDPDTAVEVRRRIPRVLASCDTQRAVDGLLSGLASEAFEVRYRCGLALDHATPAPEPVRLQGGSLLRRTKGAGGGSRCRRRSARSRRMGQGTGPGP